MSRIIVGGFALWAASHFGLALAQTNPETVVDTLYERGQWQISPNWRGLGKVSDTAEFLHDEHLKTSDGRIAVWRDREFALTRFLDKETAYLSVRERVLVDCKSRKYGISDWSYYAGRFGSGAIVETKQSEKVEMMLAVPDSLEERLIKIVCTPPSEKDKTSKG